MSSVNGNIVNSRYLQLNTSVQQSIVGNYSDVYYDVWLGQINAEIAGTIKPLQIKIDNVTVVNQNVSVNGSGWIQLYTGVKRVYHTASGSSPAMQIDVIATFGFLGIANLTVSTLESLPTIPRSTTPTNVLSDYDFGSTINLTLNRALSSYTHDIKYMIVNTEYTYTNIATSHSFVIPLIKMQSIPNATKFNCWVEVTTKNGALIVGDPVKVYFNSNVPLSIIPTCSINNPVISSGLSGYSGAIQGVSKATLSNTSAGIYSSSITSYKWEVGNTVYNTSTIDIDILEATTNIKLTVTDSRGRSNVATRTITAISYDPPKCSIKAIRCDVLGNPMNEGQYFKLFPIYSYTNINGLNNPSLRHEVLGTAYVNTSITSGNSGVLGNNDLLKTNRYVVQSTVTDKIGKTSTSTYTVEIAKVLMNWTGDGEGIAINKFYETFSTPDALQIGGNARVYGSLYTDKIYINGTELLMPIVDSGTSTNGYWIKYHDGTMIVNQKVTASLNSTAWGNAFYSSVALGNFSTPFISDTIYPQVTVKQSGGNISGFSLAGTQNKSSAGVVYVFSPASFTALSVEVFVTTVGRWK